MVKTAIILTVFNRKDVTLLGLRTLYSAIKELGNRYLFDIYMTDDGCIDGTSKAVKSEFPKVNIINGNGNLYWSGGMIKAWKAAVDCGKDYDYFLWFNDDSILYSHSLTTLFETMEQKDGKAIISGAFCDEHEKASYGGKTMDRKVVTPSGKPQKITLMNGNLVLIPKSVYYSIGLIDSHYRHGYGDYDYGLRAQNAGFDIFLTSCYVGLANRHDESIPSYFSKNNSLIDRWRFLHDSRNSPAIAFRFNLKHFGIRKALLGWARSYIYMFCPTLFYINKHITFDK